jgi:hypothetical protein
MRTRIKGNCLIIYDRPSLHKSGIGCDHGQHRPLYLMLVRGDLSY